MAPELHFNQTRYPNWHQIKFLPLKTPCWTSSRAKTFHANPLMLTTTLEILIMLWRMPRKVCRALNFPLA